MKDEKLRESAIRNCVIKISTLNASSRNPLHRVA